MADEKLHIRDGRTRDRYSVDHALFRHKPDGQQQCWAALLKPAGIAIYNAIVHHADYTSQESYPSFSTLARETGMSLSQAKREVKKLTDFQFIITIPPDEMKSSNTYLLTDKSAWILPDNYHDRYAPSPRSDKGTPNPKRSRNKKTGRVTQTPGGVSDRHRGAGVTQTPGGVSVRPQTGVTQTPEVVSDRPPNKRSQVNTLQLPITTITIQPKTDTENWSGVPAPSEQNTSGDDVGGAINTIFSQAGRKETITGGQVAMICHIHTLQSAAEVLKAIQSLASTDFHTFTGKSISNVIGYLIGSRNGDGHYHTPCFFEGRCVLPAPEDSEHRTEPPLPQKSREDPIDWQARFEMLPADELAAYRAEAEKNLSSHKTRMQPDVYQTTLRLATFRVFCAAQEGHK